MNIIALLVLWTWGLTPLWVNIVGSVLIGFKIALGFISFCLKCYEKAQED